MKTLIVGLGLLDGSYAMALKGKDYRVKAITNHLNKLILIDKGEFFL